MFKLLRLLAFEMVLFAPPVDNGSGNFPANANEVYTLVETLATQSIESAKSTNVLDTAIPAEDIRNGVVIEKAVIEMAKDYAYDPDALPFEDGDDLDPKLLVQYYSDYDERQFGVRVRKNEIRKVLMKERTVESVVAEILNTITAKEGYYDQNKTLEIFTKGAFVDYSTIAGTAKDMDGLLILIRDAYNHLIDNNDDTTAIKYVTRTDPADVRIFIPAAVSNVLDVTKLANLFNLSKVDLMARIVTLPDSLYTVAKNDSGTAPNAEKLRYTVFVADRKAFIRARRVYEYSQDINGKALYTNHYLTTETLYGFCKLFKAVKIDASAAVTAGLEAHISGVPALLKAKANVDVK